MLYLLAIAAILAFYGWHRALAAYIAVIVTIAAFLLSNALALILTFMFTSDGATMNQWQFSLWTTEFIANTSMAAAPLAPLVLLADCVRAWLWLLFNHLNIFFIASSLLWIYITVGFWIAAGRTMFARAD